MDKNSLRISMLAERVLLGSDQVITASAHLCAQLNGYIAEQSSGKVIAGYIPVKNEISSASFLMSRMEHAIIALPQIGADDAMCFRRWQGQTAELTNGKYAIPAPLESADECIPDIILLPLVAYDDAGHRLGYGGGYYDKAIAALHDAGHSPMLIGLGYEWQCWDEGLPNEIHDVRLHAIVTDEKVLVI